MHLRSIGLVLGVSLMLASAAGCEINHRSDQYACTVNADCPGGRTCDNGFCIVVGSIDAARPIDAPRGDAATTACPAPCTSCNTQQKTCTVNCMQGDCKKELVCPAGFKCDFLCNQENACRNGIDCTDAAACNVDCTGRGSCEQILCGPGPCDVSCSGPSTCRDVRCGNSCACDVTCSGNQSCSEGILCTSIACRLPNRGCTSMPLVCNSCN